MELWAGVYVLYWNGLWALNSDVCGINNVRGKLEEIWGWLGWGSLIVRILDFDEILKENSHDFHELEEQAKNRNKTDSNII